MAIDLYTTSAVSHRDDVNSSGTNIGRNACLRVLITDFTQHLQQCSIAELDEAACTCTDSNVACTVVYSCAIATYVKTSGL